MPSLAPMTPGNSIIATLTASSVATVLPAKSSDQIRVVAPSTNAIAYIAFGISTTTVVIPTGTEANGVPIYPGTVEMFTIPPGTTHVAVIGTVANTLAFTRGDGA